ncbi:MAG: hypothetical protein EA399_07815 [Desulfovibrionales bacterium]|nr:MAG: hypothetical protein EA399_07815 [Desulfovibrionales bacterium]
MLDHNDGWIGADLPLEQSLAPPERIEPGFVEVVIDVETIPGPIRPDPSTLSPPANYKNADSIAKWREENAESIYRKQALDPLKGQICSIAWAFNVSPVHSATLGKCCTDEEQIFERLTAALLEVAKGREIVFIGHNIYFDLAFIWKRSFLYENCSLLRKMIPRERWSKSVIDTQRLWQFDREFTSLDALAKFLGLEPKNAKGDEVFDMYLAQQFDKIASYNRGDVEITRQVYRRITG